MELSDQAPTPFVDSLLEDAAAAMADAIAKQNNILSGYQTFARAYRTGLRAKAQAHIYMLNTKSIMKRT